MKDENGEPWLVSSSVGVTSEMLPQMRKTVINHFVNSAYNHNFRFFVLIYVTIKYTFA